MKTINCDFCKKEIKGFSNDPKITLELTNSFGGDVKYDLCKDCANKISMLISNKLFVNKED